MAFNTLLSLTAAPTLVWNAIASAVQYHVQLSADQKFSVLEKDVTGLLTATYSPTGLATPQKHYWRFRALLSSTMYADQTNPTGAGTANKHRDVTGDTYLGQGFTPTVGQPISRIALSLKKTGTPTGNLFVEIWTSSGGAPLALLGAASANVNIATLTTSYVTYNFDFAAPIPVVAGTEYFIVLRGTNTVNNTDYANWQTSAGAFAGGNAYKGDATPVWSTNGTPGQIFTAYYYKWGTWQPLRSFFVNTAALAAYTPGATGWAFIDPDNPSDFYVFAVAPNYEVDHIHQRRSQVKNIAGDELTEFVSTRDYITLTCGPGGKNGGGSAYIDYQQMAEILRFFHMSKSIYLVGVTSYGPDNHERIWKVDFTAAPQVNPIAPGREDLFEVVLPLQESVLQ